MNLSSKKSSIHHHLTRPVFKKGSAPRQKDAEDKSAKVESGLAPLQIGTEMLKVPSAYKSIFRL